MDVTNTENIFAPAIEIKGRERLLWVLSGASFLVFFQAYMVAPLIPRLSVIFGDSVEKVGLVVPAYLIPYGVATLFYGVLADHFGRRKVIISSFLAFILLTAITGFVNSRGQMTLMRILTGLGASGIVPVALILIGDLFPYRERGRPLGWLFGAMAGGMAVGSTVGVLLEPFVSWRWLFWGVAILGLLAFLTLLPFRSLLGSEQDVSSRSASDVINGYYSLVSTIRGLRTYSYVFVNAVFHSGVFTWLGLYFTQRFGLSEVGIGLALLGYGIPGFVLGPVIGRLADRFGRSRLIPLGLLIAGGAAAALALDLPVIAAALFVTMLSLGYDLTQPLLAGIVTDLGQQRGQAMGLNVFTLFVGFGVGSLIFGAVLGHGLTYALLLFASMATLSGIGAFYLFRSEVNTKKPGRESAG